MCSSDLGLAFHNYHDAFNAFPMAWYAGSNFNLGVWGVSLLPYLDQAPLYNQYNHSVPSITELAALGYSPAAIASNINVISTVLPAFLCPSTPSGNEVYNGQLPAAANPLGTDLNWRAARSDYCASTGVRGDYAGLAYTAFPGGPAGQRDGLLEVSAPGLGDNGGLVRVRDVTDGTSNTIAIGERVGGTIVYRKGKVDSTLSALFGPSNGGGWGDFLNGEHWLKGSLEDGNDGPDGGPCGINCTNNRGANFYSFHTGGAHFLFVDGHVQFLSGNISQFVLASLITKGKGEIVGEF